MRTLLIFMLLLTVSTWGWAARKALVIGNANYSSSPLRNPINDAQLIASTLKDLDFSVTLVTDADLQRLDNALNAFITDLRPEDEAVFYYSGHGANFNGENYLIPVGREIREDTELKYHAFSSNLALERMQRAKTTVMILDACRDNPFRGARSGSKGLAIMQGKAGSQYIIYSTEQGKTAADGSGANSPFTESLARHIKAPDRIEDVMKKVTLEVKTKTYDNQIPWTAGNLIGDFYFAKAVPVAPQKLIPEVTVTTEYATGSISVESSTEGDIWLDGVFQMKIQPGEIVNLKNVVVGDHEVRLTYPNGEDLRKITVQKDRINSLSFSDSDDYNKMVYVPSGTFSMGITTGTGKDNELPIHVVTMDSFYISRFEVTQSEYSDIMGANPASGFGVGSNYPVYNVSWYSAIKYCNLRSMIEGFTPVYTISHSTNPISWGQVPTISDATWNSVTCDLNANGYRLPTEAEWEYAARGATNIPDFQFSGSDDIDAVAWYAGNNTPYGSKLVGTKAPNALGLYDMSGNFFEWCWDWFGSYTSEPKTNPIGPKSGSERVIRGGYWEFNASFCRVSSRNCISPEGSYYIGFRLCRSDK